MLAMLAPSLLLLLPLLTATAASPLPTGYPWAWQIVAQPADVHYRNGPVVQTQCLDPSAPLDEHFVSLAALNVCEGAATLSGSCAATAPLGRTAGRSANALFTLTTVEARARINVPLHHWLACVHAARQACPTGTFKSICLGAATEGDVAFELVQLFEVPSSARPAADGEVDDGAGADDQDTDDTDDTDDADDTYSLGYDYPHMNL